MQKKFSRALRFTLAQHYILVKATVFLLYGTYCRMKTAATKELACWASGLVLFFFVVMPGVLAYGSHTVAVLCMLGGLVYCGLLYRRFAPRIREAIRFADNDTP